MQVSEDATLDIHEAIVLHADDLQPGNVLEGVVSQDADPVVVKIKDDGGRGQIWEVDQARSLACDDAALIVTSATRGALGQHGVQEGR